MPQIPSYGYDETTEGELNSAKRRVIGYMDSTHERLTEYPETDPTKGKATVELSTLTDDVYLAIKSIDVLDSYIRTDLNVIELIDHRQQSSEIKKTAKELITVNNGLRKINATYDKLRPNIKYVSLSVWTDFTSAIDLLIKASHKFFGFMDKLISEDKKSRGETYDPPPVFMDDGDDGGDEGAEGDEGVEGVEGAEGAEGVEGVEGAEEEAPLELGQMQPTPPIEEVTLAPPPITNLPLPPIPPSFPPTRPGRPTRPLQPLPPIAQEPLAPPPIGQQPSGDYKNFVRGRARDAGLKLKAREDVVKEAVEFEKTNGRQATEEEIDTMIEAYTLLGPKPSPIVLAPPAELQKIEDLINRASSVKQQLTDKKLIDIIDERVGALVDARDQGRKTQSMKVKLQSTLDIAEDPTIVISKSDYNKLSEDIKKETLRLKNQYLAGKNRLEPYGYFKKRDAFTNFLDINQIPYIKTNVQSRIQAIENA